MPDRIRVAAYAGGQLAIAPRACSMTLAPSAACYLVLMIKAHACDDAFSEIGSSPITCSTLAVAEVALRVELPADHQGANITAANLHRLPYASDRDVPGTLHCQSGSFAMHGAVRYQHLKVGSYRARAARRAARLPPLRAPQTAPRGRHRSPQLDPVCVPLSGCAHCHCCWMLYPALAAVFAAGACGRSGSQHAWQRAVACTCAFQGATLQQIYCMTAYAGAPFHLARFELWSATLCLAEC